MTEELHFFYDAQSKPAFVEYEGKIYCYIHNLQGDIVGILDDSGSLVVEYKYYAWGMPIHEADSLLSTLGNLNSFRYRGYVWDEGTQLYYLRSRFFNMEVNRFINPDLDISSRGSFFKHNGFTYCGNRVILYKDVSGRGLISSLISRDKYAKKILDWYISGGGEKR